MKLYLIKYYSEVSVVDPEGGDSVLWFTSKRAAISSARRMKREVVHDLYDARQYQSISVHRVHMPVTSAALVDALNSIEAKSMPTGLDRGTVWTDAEGGE